MKSSAIRPSMWVLVLGLLAPTQVVADELPAVDELMATLDNLYRSESSYAEMEMEISSADLNQTLTIESWSKGEDMSLMVIREPSKQQGMATLKNEEGLWNYAPRADKLVRLPTSLMSDSWMGSHVTNDDLMRESSWQDDYDTTLSEVTEGSSTLIRAEMIPNAESVEVYTQVSFYVEKEGWTPVRMEFYDEEGLVRTLSYSDPQDINGRVVPMVMEIVPADEPNEYTRMTYLKLELDIEVDDSVFTPRGLRKKAQQ